MTITGLRSRGPTTRAPSLSPSDAVEAPAAEPAARRPVGLGLPGPWRAEGRLLGAAAALARAAPPPVGPGSAS